MNGVIYARYSSSNQREESIEGQIRECQDFALKNNITILGTYIDRAKTATTDNRPDFQKMIKDSGKKLFDVVIVWKLDRFARNRYDSAHYKNILKKNGVKVVSATEMIGEGAVSVMYETMLEGMAEYYSAELSEKVIRGMTENALKCRYNGGNIPIGYRVDKDKMFQLDTNVSPIINEAFMMYASGKMLTEVTEYLNENGIRTVRGNALNPNNTTRMLKNRKYIGEYQYRDIITPNGMPAVVSEEIFDKVQARFEKNKKAPARFKAEERYILTTKLFCGHCSGFMIGESGTSATGRTYNYYKCTNNKHRKGCKKKAVPKDKIEHITMEEIKRILYDDTIFERIANMIIDVQGKESTNLPFLNQRLSETERAIENMLNAIQDGIYTSSTKTRLEKLEDTKEQLEISILKEKIDRPLLTKKQILFGFYKLRELDTSKLEEKERLIDTFINAIFVYDDKIVFTFNYKEDSKTLSWEEVEHMLESSSLNMCGAP